MRSTQFLRLGAVAACLSLGACAPSVSLGGVGVGLGPSGRMDMGVASCFLGAAGGTQGMSRTANSAFSFGPRVARIQARYSFMHADRSLQRESWKGIAAGGC